MLLNKVPLLSQIGSGGERAAVQHELANVDLAARRRRVRQDLGVGLDWETLANRVLNLLSEGPIASGRLAVRVTAEIR